MKSKQDRFLELFEPLKHNLWRFCLSITKSYDDAKDLLQDTIETAYKEFDKLQNPSAFLSWLFTIASRLNLANIRNRNYIVQESVSELEFLQSSDLSPEKKYEIKLLYEALDKLPHEQSEAIILCNIIGYQQNTAAEIQNVTVEALKQRLYRGKTALKELLDPVIKTSPDLSNENFERIK